MQVVYKKADGVDIMDHDVRKAILNVGVMDAGKFKKGVYHIQTINSYHSRLKE